MLATWSSLLPSNMAGHLRVAAACLVLGTDIAKAYRPEEARPRLRSSGSQSWPIT